MSDRRRQFNDQRYAHFITFSVYKRRRLLDLDHPRKILLGVLNHQLEALGGKYVGFVVMPNHVHALIWLPDPRELTRRGGTVKHFLRNSWLLALGATGAPPVRNY